MPDKRVTDEVDRLLSECASNQEIEAVRIRKMDSEYDRTVSSLEDIPPNLTLSFGFEITVWTTDYVLYTEHHDFWPDRMGKARRNPV